MRRLLVFSVMTICIVLVAALSFIWWQSRNRPFTITRARDGKLTHLVAHGQLWILLNVDAYPHEIPLTTQFNPPSPYAALPWAYVLPGNAGLWPRTRSVQKLAQFNHLSGTMMEMTFRTTAHHVIRLPAASQPFDASVVVSKPVVVPSLRDTFSITGPAYDPSKDSRPTLAAADDALRLSPDIRKTSPFATTRPKPSYVERLVGSRFRAASPTSPLRPPPPPLPPPGYPYSAYTIPQWLPVAVFLLPPAALPTAFLFRKRTRRWRRAHGLCGKCGYDLTGNESGTCPECGSSASARVRTQVALTSSA